MTDMPLGTGTPPGAAGWRPAGTAPTRSSSRSLSPPRRTGSPCWSGSSWPSRTWSCCGRWASPPRSWLIICWFAALFLGRLPEGLAGFLAGYLRWLDPGAGVPVPAHRRVPAVRARRSAITRSRCLLRPGPLNRLAVLFRIILAIPAALLAALVGLGMETIVMFVTWLIVLIAGQMPRPLYEAIAAGAALLLPVHGLPLPADRHLSRGGCSATSRTWRLRPGQLTSRRRGYGAARPGYGPPGRARAAGRVRAARGRLGTAPPAPRLCRARVRQPGRGPARPGRWAMASPRRADQVARRRPALAAGAVQRGQGLVSMFLALGVLVLVLYAVLIGVAARPTTRVSQASRRTVGRGRVRLAQHHRGHASTPTSPACGGKLSCVNQVDAQMSQAFRTFGSNLHGVSMPTPASGRGVGHGAVGREPDRHATSSGCPRVTSVSPVPADGGQHRPGGSAEPVRHRLPQPGPHAGRDLTVP